jgi:hypothetical protein
MGKAVTFWMGSYLASGTKKIHMTTINCTPESSSTCKLPKRNLLSFPIVDKWGDRLTSKGHIICCLLEVDSLKITVHYLQWYHIFSAIWISLFAHWQFGIESLLAILDWSFCQNSESDFLCFHSLQTWSLLLWHSIYGSSEHHIYLMLRFILLTVGRRGIDIIQMQGLTKIQTLTFNLAMRSKRWSYPKPPSLLRISSSIPKASPNITYGLIQENWPTNLNMAQLIRCQLMPNTIMSFFLGHWQLYHGHNWFV